MTILMSARPSQPVKIRLERRTSFVPPSSFNKEKPLYVQLPDDARIGPIGIAPLDSRTSVCQSSYSKRSKIDENASASTRTPSSEDDISTTTSNGDDEGTATSTRDADLTPRFTSKGVYANLGSAGHPEICSRPCLYLAAGSCSNGADCVYCHFPHARRIRLDKANRSDYRSMDVLEKVSAVFYIIKERLSRRGCSTQMMLLLQQLITKDLQSFPIALQDRAKEAHSRKLMAALKSYDTGRLIWMLKRECLSDETKVVVDELLEMYQA